MKAETSYHNYLSPFCYVLCSQLLLWNAYFIVTTCSTSGPHLWWLQISCPCMVPALWGHSRCCTLLVCAVHGEAYSVIMAVGVSAHSWNAFPHTVAAFVPLQHGTATPGIACRVIQGRWDVCMHYTYAHPCVDYSQNESKYLTSLVLWFLCSSRCYTFHYL